MEGRRETGGPPGSKDQDVGDCRKEEEIPSRVRGMKSNSQLRTIMGRSKSNGLSPSKGRTMDSCNVDESPAHFAERK